MQRDVEKVEEFYREWRRGKLATMLMLMATDVEVVQSPELPWGGAYLGHEGAKEFFSRLAEHLESRLEVECLVDAGEKVVGVGRMAGKARATGLEFDLPVVHVWTVAAGQITRLEAYVENETLLTALAK